MPNDKPYIVPKSLSRPRSLDECAAELEREIAIRKRCFQNWVDSGKLTRVDAAERYERLLGVMHFLNSAYKSSEDVSHWVNPMTRANGSEAESPAPNADEAPF